jgi:hypothetical protein
MKFASVLCPRTKDSKSQNRPPCQTNEDKTGCSTLMTCLADILKVSVPAARQAEGGMLSKRKEQFQQVMAVVLSENHIRTY